eukprot:scaffold2059_cov342-Prasinococcus_capsulatus_cf.AAC.1
MDAEPDLNARFLLPNSTAAFLAAHRSFVFDDDQRRARPSSSSNSDSDSSSIGRKDGGIANTREAPTSRQSAELVALVRALDRLFRMHYV